MRIVIFCHSLVSDWNHGNAHFLRGVISELIACGHEVRIFEPAGGWSVENLLDDAGPGAIDRFYRAYPQLKSIEYELDSLDLDAVLPGASLVLVHEWNEPELAARIGEHRSRRGDYVLLFHDTHHRSVTDPAAMARYDLRHYDGVLAFGESVARQYRRYEWAERVWVWHEAADTRIFRPLDAEKEGDLVWIGNWGDDERTAELHEFLIEPVKALGLKARIYGVRYPDSAVRALESAGIEYAGWTPNFDAPAIYSRYQVTVHVPRHPYASALPGVPTIRVFEALACGIPFVSAPWEDSERMFTPGSDFLVARDGSEMKTQLARLLNDPGLAQRIAAHGCESLRARHTCAHRVSELMDIYTGVRSGAPAFAGVIA